jgi:glycosyltransferase involved in cell wall biosynthesis
MKPGQIPTASVLLPVFNAEAYLEDAIVSILEQTFANFELLLLDDGSTDSTPAILRDFARRDSRCVVHAFAHGGLVETLNNGIALSRSQILIRMDADDRSYRRRFELQIRYLLEHPTCVALGCQVMLMDPDGDRLQPLSVPIDHAAIDANHMRGLGGMIVHPTSAFRKETLVQVGGYRHGFRHAEDFDLFLRLAELGLLANLPDVLLEYRQHLTSVSHAYFAEQMVAGERALREAYQRRGLPTESIPGNLNICSDSTNSPDGIYRKWAWWALSAGNAATARKHAIRALMHAPFAWANFRLMACALRGH